MSNYNLLRDKLNFSKDLPFTPDWSAAADFLNIIAEHCLSAKPGIIVECSSGLSTLIIARCCQLNQHGRVYSLENGAEYAEKTRQELKAFGLEDYATVLDAPLENINLHDRDYLWYSNQSLPDNPIDMIVIDGPPGFIQKNSRYPALPLFYDKCSDHCTLYLDDAAREDEKEIIDKWKTRYTNTRHQYIETERGCSVLIINK